VKFPPALGLFLLLATGCPERPVDEFELACTQCRETFDQCAEDCGGDTECEDAECLVPYETCIDTECVEAPRP